MSIGQLIIGWFYYGIIYMGLSIVATVIINRVAKRYFTAPLLINALSVIILLSLLLLKQMNAEELFFNLFFIYMPIVAASVVFNLVLWMIRKGQPLRDEVNHDDDESEEKNF